MPSLWLSALRTLRHRSNVTLPCHGLSCRYKMSRHQLPDAAWSPAQPSPARLSHHSSTPPPPIPRQYITAKHLFSRLRTYLHGTPTHPLGASERIRVCVLLSPLRMRRIDTRLFRVNIRNYITVFGRRSDHSLRIADGWETASHASMLPLRVIFSKAHCFHQHSLAHHNHAPYLSTASRRMLRCVFP